MLVGLLASSLSWLGLLSLDCTEDGLASVKRTRRRRCAPGPHGVSCERRGPAEASPRAPAAVQVRQLAVCGAQRPAARGGGGTPMAGVSETALVSQEFNLPVFIPESQVFGVS